MRKSKREKGSKIIEVSDFWLHFLNYEIIILTLSPLILHFWMGDTCLHCLKDILVL
jgi:hypothetical protein